VLKFAAAVVGQKSGHNVRNIFFGAQVAGDGPAPLL
jgi:hypothetical protein